MSEPFLAEIRIFGFNFAPRNWATCDGQLLPISQNQSLYSLMGTTYGGDGRTTFALPDLRGRAPMHFDGSHPLGQRSGAEGVSLTGAEIPSHTHSVPVSSADATSTVPTNNVLAKAGGNVFRPRDAASEVAMDAAAAGDTGSNQAHQNMQPFLTLNVCIALFGLFPSRS